MTITTTTGTMHLNDDAKPSLDDRNDIIASVTRDNDNGGQFQALCDASVNFPSGTTAEFMAACEQWISAQ